MRSLPWALKLLLAGAALSMIAAAQSGTSTITGTVKDSAEAVVATARVRITNLQTGTIQDTTTNEAGLFRIGSLLPGTYRVEIQADGFQKLLRRPITVEVGQIVAL